MADLGFIDLIFDEIIKVLQVYLFFTNSVDFESWVNLGREDFIDAYDSVELQIV